jgi:transposase-like protein
VGEVARELDLTETALLHWVQQADIDQGKGPELPLAPTREWCC